MIFLLFWNSIRSINSSFTSKESSSRHHILLSFNIFNEFYSESSGILLYGLSLIYGITGATDFIEISNKLKDVSYVSNNILIISTGFVLVLSGLFFKIAAVPFHMWAPDVYEGSPTPVTAFFTTIPKIGAIAILI